MYCKSCGKKLSAQFCKECGTKKGEGEAFCQKCGQKLVDGNCPKCRKAGNLCPKCNSKIKPNHKFCIECGTPIVRKEKPTKSRQKKEALTPTRDLSMQRFGRLSLLVGSIVMIISLLALIFSFVCINHSGETMRVYNDISKITSWAWTFGHITNNYYFAIASAIGISVLSASVVFYTLSYKTSSRLLNALRLSIIIPLVILSSIFAIVSCLLFTRTIVTLFATFAIITIVAIIGDMITRFIIDRNTKIVKFIFILVIAVSSAALVVMQTSAILALEAASTEFKLFDIYTEYAPFVSLLNFNFELGVRVYARFGLFVHITTAGMLLSIIILSLINGLALDEKENKNVL